MGESQVGTERGAGRGGEGTLLDAAATVTFVADVRVPETRRASKGLDKKHQQVIAGSFPEQEARQN